MNVRKDRRPTNFERLVEAIPDIEEQIQEDKVKVIRVKQDSKLPSESNYYKAPSKLEDLKKHKGNYGIIVGYNHEKNNKSLAIIDIDGYSIKEDGVVNHNIKQKTKEYIFNCLKDIPNCLAVETASGGYHIYLWNETIVDNFHNISKALTFPEDFEIEELRNQSLEHSIEIFTKFKSKQVVLPSSSIYSNAMEQDYYYKVISDVNKLSDVATVNNVHETVKEIMIAKGFGYNEELASTSNRRRKKRTSSKKKKATVKKLKKLNDKEVKQVVDLTVPIFEAIEGSKHEGTLYLGGFFSYHISKGSTRKIATGIVKKIGSKFEDSGAFKRTLLESYERNVDKAGLPSLLDLIEDLDSDFNTTKLSEGLNLICNKNFRKEKVATVKINNIKVPVYLYENDVKKWLKYEGIIEGIDLTLDFNSLIGSFIYSKTGKEVDSFKFKFNNNYLEITKLKELTEFLAEEEITLPEYFEKHLRRSLKGLDKKVTKPKKIEVNPVEEEVDVEEDSDFLTFGISETSYYIQTSKGIDLKIETEKGIITKPIANVIIKDITIILDSLGILKPVYNVTYYNKTFNKEVTVEYLNKKQLIEEFIEANVFYISTKENVETVLNIFIIEGTKEGRIETKTEAYLEGFFIVNNKVVANTKLNNIKAPSKEELAEAIKLLNEIMKDRTEEGKANDSSVYRFMLWNPFSYCLKQLGYGKANYSLILTGKSQANKTGATKVGNLFYNHVEEETTGSTVSVLGSKLGENSFTSIFDECSDLFYKMEALNVMKRAVYEKTGRAVKDRNDNTKIDNFTALNLPLFLLNEPITFKDFITNRYKIIHYSSSSIISNKAKEKFEEKYVPESEETVLKKLAVIGKYFSTKLIEILENPSERKKLFKIEETTIAILKQMEEEAEVNFLPEMLKPTIASDKYNYDVKAEVVNLLNNDFKAKNRNITNYSGYNFTQSAINNDFDFLTYNKYTTSNTSDREFIVNSSKLVKYVNNSDTIEETVELTDILKYLGLEEILKEKAEANKVAYEDFIEKQYKIKVEGSKKKKNITGFYLTLEEVANNLFGFNIDFSKKENKPSFKYKIEKVENKN